MYSLTGPRFGATGRGTCFLAQRARFALRLLWLLGEDDVAPVTFFVFCCEGALGFDVDVDTGWLIKHVISSFDLN